MSEPLPRHLEPEIIFEDTHLIVLAKPAGLLSQGEHRGDPNLVDWLRVHFGRHYVGLIHRLDRNTSGIMVVAKRTKSAQRLTAALQAGKICRTYLGWVQGEVRDPVDWEHWLKKNPETNQVKAFSKAHEGAQKAKLHARPVASGSWKEIQLTLLEFTLETGRSHQIRAQAAQEHHPLLGDVKYGGAEGFGRPALHSHRISFPHPMSAEQLEFDAPLPEEMRRLILKQR